MPIVWTDGSVGGFGIFVAIAGGSTSGKTVSAMRLGLGLAGDRDLYVCDTEGGRTKHYRGTYPFKYTELTPPFSPHRFVEVAQDVERINGGALIFDNFTVEWLQVHEDHAAWVTAAIQRKQRWEKNLDPADETTRMRFAQAGWAHVKPPHKAMMAAFLQLRVPIIFVLRAEEKTKPKADGGIENLGWQPIQDKRFIYEWTVSITLHPETPGKPRHDLPHKIEGQHRHLFPEGQLIGEKAGEGLRLWARSGKSAAAGDAPQKAADSSKPRPDATKRADNANQGANDAPKPGADARKTPDNAPGDKVDPAEAAKRAAEFVDKTLAAVKDFKTGDAVRHYVVGKKIKPSIDALSERFPAEYARLDTGLDALIDSLEGGQTDLPAAQTAGQTGSASKPTDAEKGQTDAAAKKDEAFVTGMLGDLKTVTATGIDGMLSQLAVARTISRLETENPEQHMRLIVGVNARRAELAKGKTA